MADAHRSTETVAETRRNLAEALARDLRQLDLETAAVFVERQQAEIERLSSKLELARAYVYANQGGWCRDGISAARVLEETKP